MLSLKHVIVLNVISETCDSTEMLSLKHVIVLKYLTLIKVFELIQTWYLKKSTQLLHIFGVSSVVFPK